jgi:hypothetical protein
VVLLVALTTSRSRSFTSSPTRSPRVRQHPDEQLVPLGVGHVLDALDLIPLQDLDQRLAQLRQRRLGPDLRALLGELLPRPLEEQLDVPHVRPRGRPAQLAPRAALVEQLGRQAVQVAAREPLDARDALPLDPWQQHTLQRQLVVSDRLPAQPLLAAVGEVVVHQACQRPGLRLNEG